MYGTVWVWDWNQCAWSCYKIINGQSCIPPSTLSQQLYPSLRHCHSFPLFVPQTHSVSPFMYLLFLYETLYLHLSHLHLQLLLSSPFLCINSLCPLIYFVFMYCSFSFGEALSLAFVAIWCTHMQSCIKIWIKKMKKTKQNKIKTAQSMYWKQSS